MNVRFDKFKPLKNGDVSVMLTAKKSDMNALFPMMLAGEAELRPAGADVMPDSAVMLRNLEHMLSHMLDQIREMTEPVQESIPLEETHAAV